MKEHLPKYYGERRWMGSEGRVGPKGDELKELKELFEQRVYELLGGVKGVIGTSSGKL